MIFIYITAGNVQDAKKISEHLLKKKLVACVNIFPIESMYWWNDEIQENQEFVKIYNKYKGKGFEVYQISLDRTKESWLKGIEEDNLKWINVSDLKFWNSAACTKYNIQKLPANFLLDTTGIIIAKNLNGNDLENNLKEILK